MFENNENKYADIINLPRPASKRKPMSMHDRAAQFSPFSALTGLDEELAETARITDSKFEITEDRAAELDKKIQLLIDHNGDPPEITVEYFVPDENKEGGAYVTVRGNFKRVDELTHNISLCDGTVIPADGLYSINGTIFENIL
ncbi:MAG: hypothetical protein IJ366_10420 [Clostridia bacterium]|nr:hypothetical protein [Clostridia bacterium]